MGKEANRKVLSSLDNGLEQILQELINLLPVSAKVPSEVDRRKLFDSLSPGWDRRVRMDEWMTGISRLRRQLCGV